MNYLGLKIVSNKSGALQIERNSSLHNSCREVIGPFCEYEKLRKEYATKNVEIDGLEKPSKSKTKTDILLKPIVYAKALTPIVHLTKQKKDYSLQQNKDI